MEILMKNRKLQSQINEDALLREVVDEVKNEQLQQLWNKYGLFIIVGIALILTATISFESIKSWKDKKNQELSNAYSVAMSLQDQGRLDESLDVYTTLSQKASGVYQNLSRMQIANIKFTQDKKDEAFDILQNIVKDKNVIEQLRNVAALKLASYKLDANGSAEEIENLLMPLLEEEASSDIAREMLAMLYIREGNTEKAKSEYLKITMSENAPAGVKSRALDMINILKQ